LFYFVDRKFKLLDGDKIATLVSVVNIFVILVTVVR